MRGCIGTWAYPGGVLRARRRSVLGDTMRHFSVRILSSALLVATIGVLAFTASAQTPKKESVWGAGRRLRTGINTLLFGQKRNLT